MGNKIKNIGLTSLVLSLITAGLFFIFHKAIIARFIPTVEQIGDIKIRVKGDTSYVSSKLSVKNKMFFKIEIDSLKYKVSLFNKTYLKSDKFIGMALHPYGKDTIDFSVKIPFVAILKDLKVERKKGDSASYSINIFLHYSTVFGSAVIPINKSAKLKIPQPPELEIVEVKYKKIRLRSIQAIAKIKIINYSAINLTIKDMRYSMKILKEGNLKGNYRKPIIIKPKGTTFIDLPLEINVTNMGRTIFEVIMNKDKYDYTLILNAILESTDPVKESFHLDLTKSGKMELKK